MADVFEQTDLILCAVGPVEPFAAKGPMPRSVGDVKVSPYNGGALTIPGSVSGYPAVSLPAGLSASGLPIGLQVYARRHEDATLLDLALAWERCARGRSPRPTRRCRRSASSASSGPPARSDRLYVIFSHAPTLRSG